MLFRLSKTCFFIMYAGNLLTHNDGLARDNYGHGPAKISRLNTIFFQNSFNQAAQTPFFNETYKFSNIILKSGRKLLNVKARIDLVNQGLFFITSSGIEINIEPGITKEISYTDTTSEGMINYKFKTAYPAVDKQDNNNFYLVLAEGRCSFLKAIIKKVAERKDIVYGDKSQNFETYENYYFFSKGEMKRLKRDKDFILSELSDKQEEVNQFFQSNKINLKNNDQLVKLINYYNTL